MASIEEQKKQLEAEMRDELEKAGAPEKIIKEIIKKMISKITFIGE